jgi:hypothetical protein
MFIASDECPTNLKFVVALQKGVLKGRYKHLAPPEPPRSRNSSPLRCTIVIALAARLASFRDEGAIVSNST